MSMHDPISDMLTRIRNAQQAKHKTVLLASSKIKEAIAKVMKNEGYICSYSTEMSDKNIKLLKIELKYYKEKPVIDRIVRISRSGLRVYKSAKQLVPVPGFGITILTTSKGVMTNVDAKALGIGGELLCELA